MPCLTPASLADLPRTGSPPCITPLGGAGEVGASAALLEIAGARILIDAGIRVGSGAKTPLPRFDLLDTPPDVVLITHAHTDHTGALPLVLPHIGSALIHMTTASLHLLEVLQGDAVRAREADEAKGDGETHKVSYTMAQVEAAISRVEGHRYYERFCPVPGRHDIVCEYIPSGHILGAGLMILDAPGWRIVWSGDYSVTPQPTIGGVDLVTLAERCAARPVDLLVTEGTYGAASHPARRAETERFLTLLDRITRRGGKVLIPAFAVGRAQDIVHTIRTAKRAGQLLGVPLYLDGMVRPVTSIYENIAHESYPALTEPLALLDPALEIYKANPQSRARLLSGEFPGAAIVISSSGMLIGGRSVQYAQAFAGDRQNAILLSGYQDEESPGRALLNLKRGSKLRLGDGTKLAIRCHVGRYHTSAHADADQIEQVVAAVRPRQIALVHGETAALAALAERLGGERTVVFANGVPFVPSARPAALAGLPDETGPEPLAPALALGRVFHRAGSLPGEKDIRALWEHLTAAGERDYAESEIAGALLGPGYTPGHRDALSLCLSNHRLYFISGSKIGSRSYRPRPKDDVIEMLVERAAAWQVPLVPGDLVIFSDGSPDLFLAAVVRVNGEMIDAVIPFASRTSFRRDWLRCKTGLVVPAGLAHKPLPTICRWLEGLMREARTLPAPNPVDAYAVAMERPDGVIALSQATAAFWPRHEGGCSDAMHVAGALALAGARSLFCIRADGAFVARTAEEVTTRWKAFVKIAYVRASPPGTPLTLMSGQRVAPTGVFYVDSFEARTPEGGYTRCSYRRVVLPGDAMPGDAMPGADGAPFTQTPVGGDGAPRRRATDWVPDAVRTSADADLLSEAFHRTHGGQQRRAESARPSAGTAASPAVAPPVVARRPRIARRSNDAMPEGGA